MKFPSFVKLITLIFLMLGNEIFPQFNTVLFKRSFSFDLSAIDLKALGDLNNDGFDDFLTYDCNLDKALIFFGGNPIDTIADYTISGSWKSCTLIDLNDDHQDDIVFVTGLYPNVKVKVYYGGSLFDTMPDIVFSPPAGTKNNFGNRTLVTDYNVDCRKELLIYDADTPNEIYQWWGNCYFYNTENTFDTIPHHILSGSAVDSIQYHTPKAGDFNGDGKTDLTIPGYKYRNGKIQFFRLFIPGNSQWDFTPSQIFYKADPYYYNTFDCEYFWVIDDINNDGRDDFVSSDYGFYPYYYKKIILKGSLPVDTIPDFGLNTQNESCINFISLGDVNKDGFNDFFGKTPAPVPNIKLWLGGTGIHAVADKTWYGTDCINDDGGFGKFYNKVGDVNGDGADDIAIGQYQCSLPGTDCEQGKITIFAGDTSAHAITDIIKEKTIPTSYKLYDPYPNPFNPNTIISWYTPHECSIKISIYDMLGKEIIVLFNNIQSSGENRIEFEADKYNLASGIYIIRMEAYSQTKTIFKENKKITLIK